MRRIIGATLVAGVLVLAGCSDGEDKAGPTDLEGVSKALESAGMKCGAPKPPDQDDSDIGEPPTAGIDCTSGEVKISTAIWEKESDRLAAVALIEGLVCSFGGDGASFISMGRMLTATDDDGGSKKDQAKVLDRAAKALGAEVDTHVCEASDGPDDEEAGETTTTIGGDLRPSDEAVAEAIESYDFGETADLGGGVTVTVDEPTLGGDDAGPWLEAVVRAENRGSEDTSNPSINIVCNGSTDTGNNQAEQTYESSGDLPAGAFSEGVAHLLVPDDGRYGDTLTSCDSPAYLLVEQSGFTDDAKPARFALPDELVASLNAAGEATAAGA